MKILVEHGSSHNLGDTAQLEGVVRHLLEHVPGARLGVLDRPRLRTSIWNSDRLTPVVMRVPNPVRSLPALRRVSRLAGYEQTLRRLLLRRWHARLGRDLLAEHVRVDLESHSMSLGAWCEAYDALHIVGGGNLTDLFAQGLWQRCCLMHVFASQGKPVVLTGQQIGPFAARQSRESLQRALRRVQYCGLREPGASVQFCYEADLDPGRFAVMGDDSFGLPPADPGLVANELERLGVVPGQYLATNIRIEGYVPGAASYFAALARLLDGLVRHFGLPVVVVPIALDPVDGDIAAGHRLVQACRGLPIKVWEQPDITPALAKGVLGKAYAAVGGSYHFCTFALSQGVPAISLFDGSYYEQKARGLGRFWQDERLALPLRETGSAAALRQATAVIGDDGLRASLGDRAAEAQERWRSLFARAVQEHFGGSSPAIALTTS